jgi:hypothetical protein
MRSSGNARSQAHAFVRTCGCRDTWVMTTTALVIYVDVDDTLVRSVGTKRIPMPRVLDHVRSLHRDGATLYCWSTGGGPYARAMARELGIENCFEAFLPKPNVILDDQAVTDWRRTIQVHPLEATGTTVCGLRGAGHAPGACRYWAAGGPPRTAEMDFRASATSATSTPGGFACTSTSATASPLSRRHRTASIRSADPARRGGGRHGSSSLPVPCRWRGTGARPSRRLLTR